MLERRSRRPPPPRRASRGAGRWYARSCAASENASSDPCCSAHSRISVATRAPSSSACARRSTAGAIQKPPESGPGFASSAPSASAWRASSRASPAVPVRAASYAATATCRRSPIVRGVRRRDDEPHLHRPEPAPGRDAAAPHGRPARRLQPQALLVLARRERVDDRRELGHRLLRPVDEEERRPERVRGLGAQRYDRRASRVARRSCSTASSSSPALIAALPSS